MNNNEFNLKDAILGIDISENPIGENEMEDRKTIVDSVNLYGILNDNIIEKQINIIENSGLVNSLIDINEINQNEDYIVWGSTGKHYMNNLHYQYIKKENKFNMNLFMRSMLNGDQMRQILPASFYADIRVESFLKGKTILREFKGKEIENVDEYEGHMPEFDFSSFSRRKLFIESAMKEMKWPIKIYSGLPVKLKE